MAIWILAVFAVALVGLKGQLKGFRDDFLSIERCQALNGIAILLVVARHVGHRGVMQFGYGMNGWGDSLYFAISNPIQQLLVVTFLFFSGYGVMAQFLRKGESYVDGFAKRRLFPTWANFAVAVACYAAVHFVFRTGVPLKKVLLAFTCFDAIGNPSWYIFCILWCYAGAWLAFRAIRRFGLPAESAWIGSVVASVAYFALIHSLPKNRFWWTDTVLAFPFGMFVAAYRERVTAFLKRRYWLLLVVALVAFAALAGLNLDLYDVRGTAWKTAAKGEMIVNCIRHNVLGCVMMTVILLVTLKVKVGNPVLAWCGRHVFPIYVYHMIFFLIGKNLIHGEVTSWTAHAAVALAVALTALIAKYYPRWEIRLK